MCKKCERLIHTLYEERRSEHVDGARDEAGDGAGDGGWDGEGCRNAGCGRQVVRCDYLCVCCFTVLASCLVHLIHFGFGEQLGGGGARFQAGLQCGAWGGGCVVGMDVGARQVVAAG